MAHHGYDIFHLAPGDRDEVRCITCGSVCLVKRNCMGPTCFLDAMGKFKRLHDRFACPHIAEDWHERATTWTVALGSAASPSVAALIRRDIAEVLAEHLGPGRASAGREDANRDGSGKKSSDEDPNA